MAGDEPSFESYSESLPSMALLSIETLYKFT
jgi:hypothetical protein